MPSKLRVFLRMPRAEKRVLLRIAGLAILVRAGTRLLGVTRMQRALARKARTPLAVDASRARELARSYCGALETAARNGLRTTCLIQSLIIWSELRRAGLAADIRIGLAKTDRLAAHSWVEVDGVAVTDAPTEIARFPHRLFLEAQ